VVVVVMPQVRATRAAGKSLERTGSSTVERNSASASSSLPARASASASRRRVSGRLIGPSCVSARCRSSLASPKEIQSWIEDVCGRDMTHRVQHSVQDDGGAAFTEACNYPDGTRVLCATVLEIEGGQVVRQVGVQAWDE
jgi:hypothetical protein